VAGAWPGADWAINNCWLVCNGIRVAPVTVAAFPWERSQGLLGRDTTVGAILLQPAYMVHSFGMRFPIDVAFCDRQLRVISVVRMSRNRLTRPRVGGRAVLEATAGSFQGWRLAAGSRLEIEDHGP
jgi:uncharacterized protein